jgi:phosphoglycerate dehydrogenase-like enzyme
MYASIRDAMLKGPDLARLQTFADWDLLGVQGSAESDDRLMPNDDAEAVDELRRRLGGVDALVIWHGSPRISSGELDAAPRLQFIGDLEGDRFAHRVDTDAAWRRGIRVVDTTHGSSNAVAEWALCLVMLTLRNGAYAFRRMIAAETVPSGFHATATPKSLVGATIGLVGCGHIGRRLIRFLGPFECKILVYDPYLPKETADALRFTLTSIDRVMSQSDAVVCLAPFTPRTDRLIGARELALLRSGSAFVNVSRGRVVDSMALVERLAIGDVYAGLDVFDPEPIPADHPIKRLNNVLLSPHIASGNGRAVSRFFSLMVDELERFFNGDETMFDLKPRDLDNRVGRDPALRD